MSNLLVNACAKKYGKPVWEQQTENDLKRLNLETEDKRKRFLEGMGFEQGLVSAVLDPPINNLYD